MLAIQDRTNNYLPQKHTGINTAYPTHRDLASIWNYTTEPNQQVNWRKSIVVVLKRGKIPTSTSSSEIVNIMKKKSKHWLRNAHIKTYILALALFMYTFPYPLYCDHSPGPCSSYLMNLHKEKEPCHVFSVQVVRKIPVSEGKHPHLAIFIRL
jgi:hypothetical protein